MLGFVWGGPGGGGRGGLGGGELWGRGGGEVEGGGAHLNWVLKSSWVSRLEGEEGPGGVKTQMKG